MAKRKNKNKYVPEVRDWDVVLGMDKYGDWDVVAATAEVARDPVAARAAIEAAVRACIKGFESLCTYPKRDEAIDLCREAEEVGIDTAGLQAEVMETWQEIRNRVGGFWDR